MLRGATAAFCLMLVGCGERTAPQPTNRASDATNSARHAKRAVALPPDGSEGASARSSRIRQDIEAIQKECRAAANGDWDRWEEQTAPYRAALKARVAALKHPDGSNDDFRLELLAALDRPYFYSWATKSTLSLTDPHYFDAFCNGRPIAAASHWLKTHGIDLIFVASPSMPTVYIDHFIAKAPADGIIAPHMRKALLGLLEYDVEAVDVFRIQRSRLNGEFLYVPADNHWNRLGVRAPAKDVADRLSRYARGDKARKATPVVKCVSTPYAPTEKGPNAWHPVGAFSGTREQLAAARTTFPKSMDEITAPDGGDVPDDPSSPVLLIGDSFAIGFREALVKEANLLIRTRWGNGNMTQNFAEFLREPAILDGVRVIVWVTSEDYLPGLTQLPEPVLSALAV